MMIKNLDNVGKEGGKGDKGKEGEKREKEEGKEGKFDVWINRLQTRSRKAIEKLIEEGYTPHIIFAGEGTDPKIKIMMLGEL